MLCNIFFSCLWIGTVSNSELFRTEKNLSNKHFQIRLSHIFCCFLVFLDSLFFFGWSIHSKSHVLENTMTIMKWFDNIKTRIKNYIYIWNKYTNQIYKKGFSVIVKVIVYIIHIVKKLTKKIISLFFFWIKIGW